MSRDSEHLALVMMLLSSTGLITIDARDPDRLGIRLEFDAAFLRGVDLRCRLYSVRADLDASDFDSGPFA